MEGIIEAIFANLPVLFFILAAVFGFFKRAGNGEEYKQQKEKQPKQEPVQTYEEPQPQLQPQEIVAEPQEVMKQEAVKQVDTIKEYYEKLKERQQQEQTTQEEPQVLKPRSSAVKGKRPDVTLGRLTRKKVVEGVVFSEIFGEPRSRRPHGTAANTHYYRNQR